MAIAHVILAVLSCSGFANEAYIDVYGGTAQLANGGTTEVRMASETVRIELGQKEYTVDATFEFFNSGASTTLPVGFPEFAGGYIGRRGGGKDFTSFKSWVNGIEQETKQVPGTLVSNGKQVSRSEAHQWMYAESAVYDSKKWRIKEVAFPSKSRVVTRVRYSAPYGSGNDAMYLYGTGRPWAGNIGTARFIVRSSSQVWPYDFGFHRWNSGDRDFKVPFKISRLSEFEFELRRDDFEPVEDEVLTVWAATERQPWDPLFEKLDPQNWDYSQKRIPESMLHMLSPWQLRLLRNTFFAIHGRDFQSQDLRDHFGKVWWFKKRRFAEPANLNETEKANVKMIADYEKTNQLSPRKD